MTAAITKPTDTDEQARIEEATRIVELRKQLTVLCEDGARVFVVTRVGASSSCVSGFVVSVTPEHLTFDVVGRNVTFRLASVVHCREHHRKPDVTHVVRERNV